MSVSTDWKQELAKCDTLEEAIFQSLGAASVCWENLAGAGEFDSTRCKDIGEALLDLVRSYVQ